MVFSGNATAKEKTIWRRGRYDKEVYQKPSWYTSTIVIFSYIVLVALSKLADWLRARGILKTQIARELDKQKVCDLLTILPSCFLLFLFVDCAVFKGVVMNQIIQAVQNSVTLLLPWAVISSFLSDFFANICASKDNAQEFRVEGSKFMLNVMCFAETNH